MEIKNKINRINPIFLNIPLEGSTEIKVLKTKYIFSNNKRINVLFFRID